MKIDLDVAGFRTPDDPNITSSLAALTHGFPTQASTIFDPYRNFSCDSSVENAINHQSGSGAPRFLPAAPALRISQAISESLKLDKNLVSLIQVMQRCQTVNAGGKHLQQVLTMAVYGGL
ncbi:hypothetical protein RRG08_020588 [Elysia crispata]|uniref:Uncharacterized protein n=1 Tax=Elysia crispata TaxID=231223 RepID=A0AAE1A6J3_9GAST|nr:hypothetical protein RRG08_020588 [Elysia crispata]